MLKKMLNHRRKQDTIDNLKSTKQTVKHCIIKNKKRTKNKIQNA